MTDQEKMEKLRNHRRRTLKAYDTMLQNASLKDKLALSFLVSGESDGYREAIDMFYKSEEEYETLRKEFRILSWMLAIEDL